MVSLQNFLQLDDYNGVPLAAGKIYVYHQGRTELAEIYSDINGETPIANPAVLDDLGMQEIYVSNVYNYRVVVTDPYNNELFTRDIYPNGVDGDGNNRLYEGIDPIVVNNDKMAISAKKATLSVQDPLYFVEDSQSAVCIGLQESAYSGLPYVENSAIGYGMDGNISSISGLGFYALSANSAALADSASIAASAENAGLVTDGWETGSDGRITAYNGTAFSAGKVYSGISPVYVDNENDKIGVSSKDFLANSPLYFTEYSDRVELSISGLPPTPGLMYESGFNYESGKITGYNGSGISAGKVYTGISPVTVDNDNDTISVASAILGVQAPLYFVEDSESATILGLDTAQMQVDIPESANWNEAYSTVANNSGNWQSAADELAVLNTAKWDSTCDYVSSHSADWNNKLDADIYAEDSGTFLTALPSDVVYTADIQDMATTGDINDLVTSIAETYQTTAGMTAYATTNYVDSSVSGKYDTSSFSAISANFLTAHQDLPQSADWNSAASTVSNNSANWNNVTGKLDASAVNSALRPPYGAIVLGIDNIPISAKVSDSAYYAKFDENGTYLTSYLTAVPTGTMNETEFRYNSDNLIESYNGSAFAATLPASADAMLETVYRSGAVWDTVTGKLDGSASSSFYTTANESGFITGVPAGTMNESNFGYDASNNITAYNGSAFKAGDEFPQSATEAIDVVTGGSANWNSTTATVATNSGAWGGQGIELSAGFGIDIQLVDNKLVISLATATGDI